MRFVSGWRDRPNPKINMEPMLESELTDTLERKEKTMHSAICFPDKSLIWGPVTEVGVVEMLKIRSPDFTLTDALWQIAIPKDWVCDSI